MRASSGSNVRIAPSLALSPAARCPCGCACCRACCHAFDAARRLPRRRADFAGHFPTSSGEYTRGVGGPNGAGIYGKAAGKAAGAKAEDGALCPAIPDVDGAWSSERRLVGDQFALSTGMRVWPTFNLTIGLPSSHPELAAFDTAGRITDCRHLCFPGAVLEARTRVLQRMLGQGCTEAVKPIFCSLNNSTLNQLPP